MRIQLIFLILLFNIININAQYESIFGDSITIWSNITSHCDAVFTETHFQERDTIASSQGYKIINDFGLLRESEKNDKVWYRNFMNEEEFLIMDLSLEANDTFIINSIEFLVDTVYFEDSLKIIEFDYNPLSCGMVRPLKFRESIGPNLGFRFMLSGDKYDRKLLRCYSRDGFTVNYLSMYFGDECYNDIVNVVEIEKNKILISPNPFESRISIEFVTAERRKIILLNIRGEEVEVFDTNQDQFEINAGRLLSGVYFLRILSGNKSVVKKVVKN